MVQEVETVVTITDKAAEKATALLKDRGIEDGALRVFVVGGGCSGYQYGMAIARGREEDDIVIEQRRRHHPRRPGERAPPGGRRGRLRRRPHEERLHHLQPERHQELRLWLQLPDRRTAAARPRPAASPGGAIAPHRHETQERASIWRPSSLLVAQTQPVARVRARAPSLAGINGGVPCPSSPCPRRSRPAALLRR